MKKLMKIALFIGIYLMTVFAFSSVKAATASISASSKNVTVGQTVTISVNINAAAWNIHVTGAVTGSYADNTDDAENASIVKTLSFTPTTAGTYTATMTGDVTDGTTGVTTRNIEKSVTINVTNPASSGNQGNTGSTGGGSSSSGSNSGSSGSSTTTKPETPTTPATPTKSSNANLKNLGIRPNDFSGFRANTTTYNVTVPNDVSKVEVYAEVQDSKAKISSGTGSKTLNEGANELKVVVTAEDGTTKTYTINVTRQKKEEKTDEDNKDNEEKPETPDEMEAFGLSDLQILGITLRPSFKTDVYEYKVEVKNNDINKLDIKAVATEANSKVEILGNEELKEGEHVITITVTDETGEKNVSYQITVNKVLVKDDIVAKTSNEDNGKKQFIIIIAIAIIISIIIVVFIVKYRRKPSSAFDTDGLYYGVDLEEDNNDNNDNDDKFRKEKDSMNEEFGDIFKDGEDEFPPRKKPRGKRFK